MIGKRAMMAAAAAGLFSLPYFFSSSEEESGTTAAASTASTLAGADSNTTSGATAPIASSRGTSATSPGRRSIAAPRLPKGHGRYGNTAGEGFETVFRFDLTTDWVLQRWPRVSTTTAHEHLKGYRVPLVTGTADHDLAGSLTYFFNPDQNVQRIVFQGSTGDFRPLANFVVARHGMRPQKTPDAGLHLYQAYWNGKPVSQLQVQPSGVVRTEQPQSRFEVRLTIERPSDHRWWSQSKPAPISPLKL